MSYDETKSTFEDLEVWNKARNLRIEIAKLTKLFPKEEKYRLTDQMIRCSRSVTNNIAEGYGRFNFQESIQYCRQARGSLYELLDHIMIANEEEYADFNTSQDLRNKTFLVIKILNGYINYLRKQKELSK